MVRGIIGEAESVDQQLVGKFREEATVSGEQDPYISELEGLLLGANINQP
jgi:hypothetical protein